MKILAFYFSGTGNTAFIVNQLQNSFGKNNVEMECINIENYEATDDDKIASADYLLFAYPVYGAMAPMIMWRFVKQIASHLEDKQAIVIANQMLFSGDGGSYLARILRKCHAQIVAIEHFKMPTNLSDVKMFKVKNGSQAKALALKAEQQIDLFCSDFVKGIRFKRGDGAGSILLGSLLRIPFSKGERKWVKKVKINESKCTRCGKCERECPVEALRLVDGKISQVADCTLCYRCVNRCPDLAISILGKNGPSKRYEGL
ncbi:MAG: hypothetical protein BGO41_08215 [Clostridiales bacterium 38-18]|nr:MAG: hypothetical protein BGO41_08215 [Clostridiales bacterium 38-18]